MKFKVGDEVIRSICGKIGVITHINERMITVEYPKMPAGSYLLDGTAGKVSIRKLTKLEKAMR